MTSNVADYSAEHPKSKCACGHTGDGGNSQHDNALFELGHGACKVPGCKCKRFTWAGWLSAFVVDVALVS